MSKKHRTDVPRPTPESLGLPKTGVDSHAHLDHSQFGQDLDAVMRRAADSGIVQIGNVFLSLEAWETGSAFFARSVPGWPEVFYLLGIHPTDAMLWHGGCEEGFRRAFATDPRLRALGEIGLDYYWKDCPPDVQRSVFSAQLVLAKSLQVPVVIHSRDAFADTLALLLDLGFSGHPLLWHCFGGTEEQAQTLIREGWHISIPGTVTFNGNDALRRALHAIPPDRLLLETDCPYLAPVPCRGSRNEPAYTVFTAEAAARELGQAPCELWTRCGDNARRFFGV